MEPGPEPAVNIRTRRARSLLPSAAPLQAAAPLQSAAPVQHAHIGYVSDQRRHVSHKRSYVFDMRIYVSDMREYASDMHRYVSDTCRYVFSDVMLVSQSAICKASAMGAKRLIAAAVKHRGGV